MTASEHGDRLYIGIEAGGTKWVCVVGTGPNQRLISGARLAADITG